MFSVIIPVFNKLPHLERAINSVLNQTYQDFELILIDDASTDGSSEKIREFQDPRIKIFKREEPGPGGYAARNLGIEMARGEWVAFLDADDEWETGHLESIHDVIIQNPDAEVLSCGWVITNNGKNEINSFYKRYNIHRYIKIDYHFFLKCIAQNMSPMWTSVVCLKNDSDLIGVFPENYNAKRGGDTFAWLKYLSLKKNFYWSNHIGSYYHVDTVNQVTRQSRGEYNLFNIRNFVHLSLNLDTLESRLLKKVFNIKIVQNFYLNINDDDSIEYLSKNYMFSNFLNKCVTICLLHLLPRSILKLYVKFYLRYL